MEDKEFRSLLEQLSNLDSRQKDQALEVLARKDSTRDIIAVIEEASASDLCCPRCKSTSFTKFGIISGLQRYRCKECGRTFNALSNTPMSHLRKKELWLEYSKALEEGLSLFKAAKRCGIDRTTAFRWRHRFLRNISQISQNCSGITEIDETYFHESFKGKKLSHRQARKRSEVHIRGHSREQIPVVVARDRNGNTCDGVLRDHSSLELKLALSGRISPDSLLCIEKTRPLVKFAKDMELAFELVGPKQRHGREKFFHVQNVNAYHSRLKGWMRRFNGVATERLPHYLGWMRLLDKHPSAPSEWVAAAVTGKINK